MSETYIYLKSIKRTEVWRFIIEYFFFPIFHFFWSFILNFKAKFLYYLWNLKKKEFFKIGINEQLLILDELYFKKIAEEIFKETNKVKDTAKKKLLNLDYESELKKHVDGLPKNAKKYIFNKANSELPYSISLYEYLSPELKKKIVAFASSDKMITTASKYMKIFPMLTIIQVILNIPRENSAPRSGMLWHKDGQGFKCLDFFMNISDVDEDSGPFFFLNKKIKAGVFKSFDYNMTKSGERNKVTEKDFNKKFENSNQISLCGKKGTGVFINTFSTFHKGGFCNSKDRVLLRFCYQSHDALCDNFAINSHNFIYDKNINKKNVDDIFRNYFFFKRPSKLMKILSERFLKFYHLIEYKYKL